MRFLQPQLTAQRGTYTSHGSIKRGNRKSEILLREAEYAATMASLIDADYEYPKEVSSLVLPRTDDSDSMPHGRISCCVNSMMFCPEVASLW